MLHLRNEYSRTYQFLMGCFFLGMILITSVLIFEYRFYRDQVRELNELKNSYHTCIQALRRQVLEHDGVPSSAASRKDKTEKRHFLVVNREPQYTKREALKFARAHNLERRVSRLYKKSDQHSEVTAKKRSFVRAKPKKTIKRTYRIKKRRVRRISCHRRKGPVANGKMLELKKKLSFNSPLSRAHYWISSPFGPRKNPDGTYGFHTGIDLAAVLGTPIKSSASGKVLQAGYYKGYGNMILLSHDYGVKTRYAHLNKIHVRVGQKVEKGQLIGKVGNTGHVRRRKGRGGFHLHFEVYVAGKRIDPMGLLD